MPAGVPAHPGGPGAAGARAGGEVTMSVGQGGGGGAEASSF